MTHQSKVEAAKQRIMQIINTPEIAELLRSMNFSSVEAAEQFITKTLCSILSED